MSNAEKKNIAPIIPDLNRKDVKERQFGTPAVDFAAFCRFRGALKLWDFIVTDLNATFYKAEFTVLELLPDLSELATKGIVKDGKQVAKGNDGVAIDGGFQFVSSKKRQLTTMRVGDRLALLFPVGRQGDAKDPGKPVRDDDRISTFIATVLKKTKGDPSYDGVAELKRMNELKKFEHDALQFWFNRVPREYDASIVDPETKAILKEVTKIGSDDKFEIVT